MTEQLAYDGRKESNDNSFVGRQFSLWDSPSKKEKSFDDTSQKQFSAVLHLKMVDRETLPAKYQNLEYFYRKCFLHHRE